MKAKYIGKDGSLGFKHGEIYEIKVIPEFDVQQNKELLRLSGRLPGDRLWKVCVYSSETTLSENWDWSTGFNRLDDALKRDSTSHIPIHHPVPGMHGFNMGHAPSNTQGAMDALYNLPEDANPKVNKHKEITQLLTETYRSKNKDYGDAFGKSHEKYGAVAGLSRMGDKFNRIEELILTKEQLVDDESVLDTLLDLANYSIMLYMELEGEE